MTDAPSESTSLTLGSSLGGFLPCFSERAVLVALIFGRAFGFGEVLLAGVSLGGSFGACRTFQAGLTLGAAPDLVAVMLMKSRS